MSPLKIESREIPTKTVIWAIVGLTLICATATAVIIGSGAVPLK
jgi:hypothetical protein